MDLKRLPKTFLLLCIDTNKYAGNFERELCAYATGAVGECGVGKEMAELFLKDHPNLDPLSGDYVSGETDDDGCFRPVTILKNYNYWRAQRGECTTVGIFLDEKPPDELLQVWVDRIRDFCTSPKRLNKWLPEEILVDSIRLVEYKVEANVETLEVLDV